MARGVVIAVSALLVAVAPAAGERGRTADCAATLANQIADTGTGTQLITVVSQTPRATHGTLQLWRKSGDCWVGDGGPWFAWLGQHGVSETRHEGDRTTPAGSFPVQRTMFGLAPNPGVHYAYRRIRCGDWWVEDPNSPYYNQFRHVRCGSKPPFRVTSEDMSRSPTAYRYLAVIDFNTHPIVRGRGSGIFLHHSTGRPTLGCVSLPLAALVKTLRSLRPEDDPLIVIGTAAKIRSY
jgi:L,D-peptidoglycan transpeptidase YkuD (ErfK/YbiS/YcfS/YnhG family)